MSRCLKKESYQLLVLFVWILTKRSVKKISFKKTDTKYVWHHSKYFTYTRNINITIAASCEAFFWIQTLGSIFYGLKILIKSNPTLDSVIKLIKPDLSCLFKSSLFLIIYRDIINDIKIYTCLVFSAIQFHK